MTNKTKISRDNILLIAFIALVVFLSVSGVVFWVGKIFR